MLSLNSGSLVLAAAYSKGVGAGQSPGLYPRIPRYETPGTVQRTGGRDELDLPLSLKLRVGRPVARRLEARPRYSRNSRKWARARAELE